MKECPACQESAMGHCFSHIPSKDASKPDEKPTYEELVALLDRAANHEGFVWKPTGSPFKIKACNNCGKEWRSHDSDCVVVLIQKTLDRAKSVIAHQ